MTYKNRKPSIVHDSKEGYDKYAKFYDKTLEYLDSFEQGKLMGVIGKIKGKKVLDVGCGTGRIIKALTEKEAIVTGVDLSPEMILVAKKKFPKIEFAEADAEKLPFKDEEFDVVVASFLIVHLKTLQKAFDEIYRVIKPGGFFVVTNINQRKAPKLKLAEQNKIVIDSYYHMPDRVTAALEDSFFFVEKEEFVYESGIWINQIVKAVKK